MSNQARRERGRKLRRLVSKLESAFGRRRRRRRPDPLETILLAILADGVADERAVPVLENLRRTMVDWNELRVTSVRETEEMLSGLPEPALKAAVIRSFLQRVFAERHAIETEFMKRWSGSKAHSYLDEIEGMTGSMKARALLKGFETDLLPMTTDIIRVLKRVGILESHLTPDKAEEAVNEILAPKRIYAFFYLVNEHAVTTCLVRTPNCQTCVVRMECTKFATDPKGSDGEKSEGE